MNVDDYTQPLESVMRRERAYSYPLRPDERRELFAEWCRVNPEALRVIELTAIAIDARGIRVSTKYLIEKQRYEGRVKLVGVPFRDGNGHEHVFSINNTDSALLARWLLGRTPEMNLQTRKSMFDKESKHEEK